MPNVLERTTSAEEYNGVKQVDQGKTRGRTGKGCTSKGEIESFMQRLMMHHSPSSTDAAVVVLYKAIC